MATVATAIGLALKARIETVTTGNGYVRGFARVFFDKIPMGLELGPDDLPACFILDDGATIQHQHQFLEIQRSYRLQIVDKDEASDEDMAELIRAVAKGIYANSPTAQVQDQFRFTDRVVWVELSGDDTDLHMIDANRIAALRLIVHYRTRPYDL